MRPTVFKNWLRIARKAAQYNMRLFVIFLVPMLLTRCATGTPTEADRRQLATLALSAENQECIGSIFAKADYDHLRINLFLSSETNESPPRDYLTDNKRPTKNEISQINKLHADLQKCRKAVLNGAANVNPEYIAIMSESYSTSDALWAEFASGHMTWGKFNTRIQSIAKQQHQRLTETGMAIASQ
jgi:hypothetical protein